MAISAPFLNADMQIDKRKALNVAVLSMAVFTVCFFICACVVADNANAGFNVVLTALIYVGYTALLAYVFNKKREVDAGMDTAVAIKPMIGGVLIGMTTMMAFLSLMTAIYWGEMSGCETGTDITGYSCIDASGMAAVAWFASFLLVVEVCLLFALISWKDDLFVEGGEYDNFDAPENRGGGYTSSAYAYDGATFGTGGIGGSGSAGDLTAPQQADL